MTAGGLITTRVRADGLVGGTGKSQRVSASRIVIFITPLRINDIFSKRYCEFSASIVEKAERSLGVYEIEIEGRWIRRIGIIQ
jgi:hypothetical protein